MYDIEILGSATKAHLEDEAYGIFIETNCRLTKTRHKMEVWGRDRGGWTHRAPEPLRNQSNKFDPQIKAEIRESSHERRARSATGAIGEGRDGGGGAVEGGGQWEGDGGRQRHVTPPPPILYIDPIRAVRLADRFG